MSNSLRPNRLYTVEVSTVGHVSKMEDYLVQELQGENLYWFVYGIALWRRYMITYMSIVTMKAPKTRQKVTFHLNSF